MIQSEMIWLSFILIMERHCLWIRYMKDLKRTPIDNVRLATPDETMGSEALCEFLRNMEAELHGPGRTNLDEGDDSDGEEIRDDTPRDDDDPRRTRCRRRRYALDGSRLAAR